MQEMSAPAETENPEDAVITAFMRIGKRLSQKHPGDLLDPNAHRYLHIASSLGPSRVNALAERMGVDASTASRAVAALEADGLVVRSPDPDDGRASLVSVSDAGSERLRAAMESRRAVLVEALVHWKDSDKQRLADLLTRFAEDVSVSRPDTTFSTTISQGA